MEFKKKKEKVIPVIKYKVTGDALKDCKARFITGVNFSNQNIIPSCKGVMTIGKEFSFYNNLDGDIMIELNGAWGSYTVFKDGVFANIIP